MRVHTHKYIHTQVYKMYMYIYVPRAFHARTAHSYSCMYTHTYICTHTSKCKIYTSIYVPCASASCAPSQQSTSAATWRRTTVQRAYRIVSRSTSNHKMRAMTHTLYIYNIYVYIYVIHTHKTEVRRANKIASRSTCNNLQ